MQLRGLGINATTMAALGIEAVDLEDATGAYIAGTIGKMATDNCAGTIQDKECSLTIDPSSASN